MSATVDTNVLVYASDASSRFHDEAADVLRRLARGPDLLYLFWPVVMAYLRVATHPRIFARPISPGDAMANVESLLALPHVRTTGEADGFWSTYRATTDGLVVRGNLVPDAHLVALMRQHGVGTVWTHDRDFRKFEAIRIRDPFGR